MKQVQQIRYADRSGFIGFRCSENLRDSLERLAKRANTTITQLMSDFAEEGAHRKARELDQRDRQRLTPA